MTPRLLKIFLSVTILLILAFIALPALAAIVPVPNVLPGGGPCGFAGGPPCAGATANTIITFVRSFVNMAIALIGILAVIFLVYAGVKYIMSRGEEEEAKRAKMQIAYAVIGITVAIGAYTITNAIVKTGEGKPEAGAGLIINNLLVPLVQAVLLLVGIAAVIFLVYAGFKYISSRGDEEEAKQAKMQIAYAIIGITVVLLAAAIANYVIVVPLGGAPAPVVSGMSPLYLPPGITAVVNSLLGLVGIAAVIFLVYAGVKYISSTGDEEEAGQAKRQIVYAIIGLTVVGLAAAIVRLVSNFYIPENLGLPAVTVEGGIRAVVNALLSLVGIAAVIFVVYAGVKYIMSEGDEEEASQAKRQIVYAIIGLTVVLLSAVVVNLVIGAIQKN